MIVDCRNIVTRCQQYDWRAMDVHKVIRHDHETADRLAPERCHDRFNFGVAMNGRHEADLQRLGSGLERGQRV